MSSKATPKVIVQHADPSNPRCIVKVFEKYLSFVRNGRFYMRPMPNKDNIQFSNQPVGKNTLSKYMKTIFHLPMSVKQPVPTFNDFVARV